ncbi:MULTISPECIES: glycerophosphoryl diester phosphodiesterase membrane domain-containing protein [unclassified Rathayibacter]|uniref:glycerophosphoryl diester phosphodiesterase membrane domain-containing protein n=1 Tax=unclassified Rathayibacter TaxID=2609250 RepID=UPI00188C0459|nr:MULTISPECIES: glycerophosphoryl diester phosphodiesterase membrane domain-containing protein [unclassified Rathayibacter]MBF4463367.1 glycerophosphoryl diester phosphodiesterase membrane domain-containing protein [Rathayibacter sp. VKM Ac-2879]MBF4504910.1 glycerophosphoryl diester phosphodiesterase membrane domain-containing protein [Rathayibacter sp. VKM Ac-2878]
MTDAAPWPPPAGHPDEQPSAGARAAAEPAPARQRPVPPSAPPAAPTAAWSPPSPAGWGTSPWQTGAPSVTPSREWTPPPRPGLIPLRPLGFGTLLGAPFQVLRRSPRTTLGVALLVQGLGSTLALLAYGAVALFAVSRIAQAEAADRDAVGAGSIALVVLAALLPWAVSLLTGALVQGVVVVEVSRGVLGERPRLAHLVWRLRGRFWALVAWTLLQGVGIVLLALVAVALAVPLFLLGAQNAGASAIIGGILVLLLAGTAALALGVWLGTRLALVPCLIVIERLPLRRAVARSWRLVGGGFWRTFGALALMSAIVQVAGQVVTTPISLLLPIVASLISPTDPNGQLVASLAVTVLSVAIGLVVGAVGTVLQSAVTGLLYLDRRMRLEGFDLVLMRHVEERAAGRDSPDPFPAPERP